MNERPRHEPDPIAQTAPDADRAVPRRSWPAPPARGAQEQASVSVSVLGTVVGQPHFAIIDDETPRLWFLLIEQPRRYRVTCEHPTAVFTHHASPRQA